LQEAAHYIKGAAANLGLKGIQHYSTLLDALGKELKTSKAKNTDNEHVLNLNFFLMTF
jgi:HPt (histidine-containing phosphotransfer) domain-containing protein